MLSTSYTRGFNMTHEFSVIASDMKSPVFFLCSEKIMFALVKRVNITQTITLFKLTSNICNSCWKVRRGLKLDGYSDFIWEQHFRRSVFIVIVLLWVYLFSSKFVLCCKLFLCICLCYTEIISVSLCTELIDRRNT